MTRAEAICALLEQPDPSDIRRGHVLTIDGKPDRKRIVSQLALAFTQWHQLQNDQRAIEATES